MPGPSPPVDDVERSDHTVDDGPVVVSIHRPKAASGRLACVVWMHGGGTILGNRHLDNLQLERWYQSLGVCSVSLEYRLAPEHPFPIPLADCYQALSWTMENADELGIDLARISVGGKSAGGLFAAAVAQLARDRGGPPIRCQILYCPMLDDRQRTHSSQVEGVPVWSLKSNAFGWRCYLGARYGSEELPAIAAPAGATDFSGLPPAFDCGRRSRRLAGRGRRVGHAPESGQRSDRVARLSQRTLRQGHVPGSVGEPEHDSRPRRIRRPPCGVRGDGGG